MTIPANVQERLASPLPLFIDGTTRPAASGRVFPITNPATGKTLCEVHEADAADVDQAVKSARKAFSSPAWSGMHASQREALLHRIADRLDERAEELGWLETLSNGKVLADGIGDVGPSSDIFRYYAGWVRKICGQTIPVDGNDLVYTLRQPVGVCGQIVPWNYPLLMASWKIAPAIACGCTVVLKPSEWTPLTALVLAEICHEVGVPAGVVNVVPGYGGIAGDALARHMDVDKLAFTGSTATARKLLQASAESNLKKLSLELGGKSPLVVFPDANLKAAAKAAFHGSFGNQGEVCSASSRLLVHEDVKEALLEELVKLAKNMKVGDPLDSANQIGALVSQSQLTKVLGYIESGKNQGAKLLCGGERLASGSLSDGYFVAPTIFDEVSEDMTIAQEEIFGPVLSVLSFKDEEEAIEIANRTTYGLVSAVFTTDVQRAHRVAHKIQAGVVWINRWNGFDSAAPFGGVKQSGWGREMGQEAVDLYTQTKCIWVKL